jgi:hypothetical protein
VKNNKDIQIGKNAFSINKLELLLQRIGYFLMLFMLILGFFGFFGEGVFKKISGDNLNIKYDKTIRRQSSNILELNIKNISNSLTTVPILFSIDYLKKFYIKQIMPTPLNSRFENGKIIYEFLHSKNSPEMKVVFLVEPQKSGIGLGKISDMNGNEVNFEQFIYP